MGSPNWSYTNQNAKLPNRSKLEKRDLSYADLHSEVTKNVNNMPPRSYGSQQKQAIKKEELVKHMSKLPTYLERGENRQDKILNVGVLDWRSLEKWHYNHKQILDRSRRDSTSSSNTSSALSTDGLSNHSSRGHSSSPAREKMRRPSLQSYLIASPSEGKLQDLKAVPSKPLKGVIRQSFHKNPSEIKLKESKTQDSLDFQKCGEPWSSKGKMKVQDGESMKEPEKLHDCPETVVLLLPKDDHVSNHTVFSHPFDSIEINGQKSRRRSFTEGSHSKEVYQTELYSDIPHSCPLPHEDDIKHLQIEEPSSINTKSLKLSSGPTRSSQSSLKKSISPSRRKILEEKKSTVVAINSTLVKSCKGLDPKIDVSEGTKARDPSPTLRFIQSMGRIGRNYSSKHVPAKSGEEKAEASACLDNSTIDKQNTTAKARSSSPLRRLLDPLLKPKAAISHQSVDPSQRGSTSSDRAHKSSDGLKLKLDLMGCKKTGLDLHNGSSTVQALLKVAVKNGLPLFTFAVDNSSDVLAATMRRLSSSRKEGDGWIYTFFRIREMRKKNGNWIKHGGNGKGHGYVPNVVAQMKVCDSPLFSNLSGPHSGDQFGVREFVLFAADSRALDQQTSDVQPNDELAAIVVKLPRKSILGLNQAGLKESYTDSTHMVGYTDSREKEENGFFVGSEDPFSTTVILPGGDHGLPSKGEPSPLIRRWKSGGSCDCGGWDLGCRVTVLANQTQLSTRSKLTEARQRTGQFELFSLSQSEDVLDKKPVFSLSSFQNGIFSVEFNSPLSLIQAFSVCIAVLDSRKPSELSEWSHEYKEKVYEETTVSENGEIDNPSEAQVEVPAGYASYPPPSPVGRV